MGIKELNYIKTQINTCEDVAAIRDELLPKVNILLPVGNLPNDAAEIRLRAEAVRVQRVAQERLALLANRAALYGNTSLPSPPPDLTPYFGSGFAHFEACVKKVLCAQEELTRIEDFAVYPGYEKDDLILNADIDAIEEMERGMGGNHPLNQCVRNFLHHLKQSYTNKIALLLELAQSLDLQTPFVGWCEKDQMRLLVRAEQILSNPYEPKFKTSDLASSVPALKPLLALIDSLRCESTASYFKNDFWDYVPELERKAHRLAEKSGQELLQEMKTEGLLKIIQKHPNTDPNPYLILGAGPAGLTQAISLILQGKDVQIVEKRGKDKEERLNTVTFGKWNPQELKILLFLGVLSRLEGRSSFGHNRAYYTETALGDLERALEETLHALSPTCQIQYETVLEKIHPNGHVELTGAKLQRYTAVVSAEGAHSGTRSMLGIGVTELSKPTQLSFTIYKKDPNESTAPIWKIIAYRVTNALRGLWIIIKVLFYSLVHQSDILKAASHVLDDGPAGLSRLNKHDYQLSIFRQKEQKVLESYQDKITVLHHLSQDPNLPIRERQKRLEEKSKKLHGPLDFLHTVFRPKGHTMRPIAMVLEKTTRVDIMLRKAERSQMKLGESFFTIRGDASHTTDPYSGTGAKMAIEETVADAYFWGLEQGQRGPFDRALWEMSFQSYQDKMFKGAFAERLCYYLGTEQPAWYADLALKQSLITEADKNLYLNLQAKKEASLALTDEERQQASNLREKCLRHAGKSIHTLPLKNWEKQVIQKAMDNPSFASSNLEGILNKLCCLGHPIGALLQISTLRAPSEAWLN
jgi:2-polyprenyl-6-methoxyphenol hydroxylase-like FAD-dependent oxidoreductase